MALPGVCAHNIDSIEVEQMDLNWTPNSYETDTATVYEINTFNDYARFELLNSLNSPAENFKLSLSDRAHLSVRSRQSRCGK